MSAQNPNERGSISGFVVVLAMTFVACAGLAFDGGRMIAARVEATDAAENAARAGAQQVTSLRSGSPRVDKSAAVTSANRFLETIGVTGEATADENSVTVTTYVQIPMILLGMFGVRGKSVSAVRSAQPFTEP
jgi:hypothetical protein